jgi:prevent-host-death family protein
VIEVSVQEAETHFVHLLQRVEEGEEILISDGGHRLARLVPVPKRKRRRLGIDEGAFEVPADFNAPLFDQREP